ncbi:hypothetical protein H9P43_002284 [Blastocladiella emersonii ATCC 22665]|nr:hypothetical protein H9P43_002284 [Blastocladiella emersonii ATCC 22665]
MMTAASPPDDPAPIDVAPPDPPLRLETMPPSRSLCIRGIPRKLSTQRVNRLLAPLAGRGRIFISPGGDDYCIFSHYRDIRDCIEAYPRFQGQTVDGHELLAFYTMPAGLALEPTPCGVNVQGVASVLVTVPPLSDPTVDPADALKLALQKSGAIYRFEAVGEPTSDGTRKYMVEFCEIGARETAYRSVVRLPGCVVSMELAWDLNCVATARKVSRGHFEISRSFLPKWALPFLAAKTSIKEIIRSRSTPSNGYASASGSRDSSPPLAYPLPVPNSRKPALVEGHSPSQPRSKEGKDKVRASADSAPSRVLSPPKSKGTATAATTAVSPAKVAPDVTQLAQQHQQLQQQQQLASLTTAMMAAAAAAQFQTPQFGQAALPDAMASASLLANLFQWSNPPAAPFGWPQANLAQLFPAAGQPLPPAPAQAGQLAAAAQIEVQPPQRRAVDPRSNARRAPQPDSAPNPAAQ